MKTGLLVTGAVIGLLAALVLPAQARAFTRARQWIANARAWHQARLEIQLLTMDFPELDPVLAPVVEVLNGSGGEK